MKTTKVNIGLGLSRKFQNVKLELVEEPIEHETDAELRAGIQKKFQLIKDEIEFEFLKI